MQVSQAIPLTLGVLVTANDPASNGGNSSVAVQVQNNSGFVLNVVSQGDQYSIPAFFAQTIPISPPGITILPSQSVGGNPSSANTVTLEWLLNGESSPVVDGTLTADAIAALAVSTVDNLGRFSYVLGVVGTPVIGSALTALHPYNTVAVTLSPPPGVAVAVLVNNGTDASGPQVAYGTASSPFAFQNITLFFPIPCQTGDTIQIYYIPLNTPILNMPTSTFGFGAVVQPDPLRNDSRSRPRRSQTISGPTSSAGGTLLAAPTSPGRYLISGIQGVCLAGGGGTPAVEGTIGGAAGTVLAVLIAGQVVTKDFGEEGLLLDPATSIFAGGGVAGTTCYVIVDFDLVA